LRFILLAVLLIFCNPCSTQESTHAVIEVDEPAIFIKTVGSDTVEILTELDRNDRIFSVLETSDYIIFSLMIIKTLNERDTLIYRKSDRKFFRFYADGGNGSLLYVINKETRSFDFYEITVNGRKEAVVSIPMPNDAETWIVLSDSFLESYIDGDTRTIEIYKIEGTALIKYAETGLNFNIFPITLRNHNLYGYYFRSQGRTSYTTIVNLSTMNETSIENVSLVELTKEAIFFTSGDKLGYYCFTENNFFFLENIIRVRTPISRGHLLSDFFIHGFEEFPIKVIYSFTGNQLLFNSNNRICKYYFNTNQISILFDHNSTNEGAGFLYNINSNYYFYSGDDKYYLVSLIDRGIICEFIVNWIKPEDYVENTTRSMWFYETREADIIFYTVNTFQDDK